jgi:hypothetical protein
MRRSNSMRTWKRLKLLSLPLILSATSACVHDLTEAEIKGDYCRIAGPITYDTKADTPETVKQIERHNSQFVCVCEGDCPTKTE